MKKTILITALALCFALHNSHASNPDRGVKNYQTTTKVKVNPFCTSIAKGDLEIVKRLMELGSDVNQKSEGMTPIMYAAKYNRTNILQLLIENGADIKAKSSKGITALKYAELHKATEAKAMLEEALKSK